MTLKEAVSQIGSLSAPSKMPCHGYSIPAVKCIIGRKMRLVKNSICSVCYALKGRYMFPNVQKALFKRFDSLGLPGWVDAMVFQITKKEKSGFFRWHDSGDIQGVWHLENMAEVARRLPKIKFWLPTREYAFVGDYLEKHGEFPENLTVRLSGLMLDGKAPAPLAKRLGVQTSGAHATEYNCPASHQGNECVECRLCWDKSTFQINYKKH